MHWYPTKKDIVIGKGISPTVCATGWSRWRYDTVPALRKAAKEFARRFMLQHSISALDDWLREWIVSELDIILEFIQTTSNARYFVLKQGVWNVLDTRVVALDYRSEIADILETLLLHELHPGPKQSVAMICTETLAPYDNKRTDTVAIASHDHLKTMTKSQKTKTVQPQASNLTRDIKTFRRLSLSTNEKVENKLASVRLSKSQVTKSGKVASFHKQEDTSQNANYKKRYESESMTRGKSKKRRKGNGCKKIALSIDDLTYDWSDLMLGTATGSASWNRLLFEKYTQENSDCTRDVPQQVSAIETLYAMQSLEESLVMVLPPVHSPLHSVIQQHECSPSLDDIPMDLRTIFPRLVNMYRSFMAQDCQDDNEDESTSFLVNGKKFHHLTATEVKQYLRFLENDNAVLDSREERIFCTSQRLGLLKSHAAPENGLSNSPISSNSAATVSIDCHHTVETQRTPEPICWQEDFESLLRKGGEHVSFLKIHDQY